MKEWPKKRVGKEDVVADAEDGVAGAEEVVAGAEVGETGAQRCCLSSEEEAVSNGGHLACPEVVAGEDEGLSGVLAC